jgi:hypothetical protein
MKDADSPGSANHAWYRLRNAVFDKEFDSAELLLVQNAKLIEARNGIGETVLHFLAVEDDAAGVAWLRARGADIDTKTPSERQCCSKSRSLPIRSSLIGSSNRA